ncbi:MAG: tetratricopeptide repeat protein [Deltaproteobacteria bacterium]|nr:tetratricopeptide repeat protein [Deltaproteobacteria bacterium]
MSRQADEQAQGQEWVLIGLDEKMARKQGMPFRIPVPKEEFEGLADKGLQAEVLRGWIQAFLTDSPLGKDGNWRRRNSELVTQLEGFVDKKALWDKAQKLFADNDFEAALKTLKRITIMCAEDHAARLNYASALGNQREYDKALKELKQIRDTFADDPDFHVTYAQMHVMKGDEAAATESLVKALELKPDHMPAMDALAKLGVLAKIYENPRDATSLVYVKSESLREYLEEQVWSQGDRHPEYFLEQMGYHASEQRHEVALAAADRALVGASGAQAERAAAGKVAALRELGRNDDAIAAAKAFLAEHEASASVWIELSGCHARAENTSDADAAVERALTIDPGDSMALALQFWPADRTNLVEVKEAIPNLEDWCEKHPSVAGAWRSLARAKLTTGAEEEALGLFDKAVVLAPNDDDLRSEYWSELAKLERYQAVIDDSRKLADMAKRSWQLRWNEAEAYRGLARVMEARACFMQLNADDSLAIDVRKRAKRAAMELGTGTAPEPTT